MNFMDKLRGAWRDRDSLVCVGLDPDAAKLPAAVRGSATPIFDFNRAIVDATAEFVCAYKPQAAYYAGCDADAELALTIRYIRDRYPEIPVILDAKRGDIGATAKMYAKEAFERYGADAVTVNPYMGTDALQPFLDYADRGVVVLCRTSNPGGDDLQNLVAGGRPVYEHVAMLAANRWNANGNVLLVVGATYPGELKKIRELCPEMPFLVPGVGAQGGDVGQVLANGRDAAGAGLVINSSRGIIYASGGDDFAAAAGRAARELRDEINRCRRQA